MGPATATPFFLLLLILAVVVGAVLVWTGFNVSGMVIACSGLAVFLLHKMCVIALRNSLKKDSASRSLSETQKADSEKLRETLKKS